MLWFAFLCDVIGLRRINRANGVVLVIAMRTARNVKFIGILWSLGRPYFARLSRTSKWTFIPDPTALSQYSREIWSLTAEVPMHPHCVPSLCVCVSATSMFALDGFHCIRFIAEIRHCSSFRIAASFIGKILIFVHCFSRPTHLAIVGRYGNNAKILFSFKCVLVISCFRLLHSRAWPTTFH